MEGKGVMRYADGDVYEVFLRSFLKMSCDKYEAFFEIQISRISPKKVCSRACGNVACERGWVKLFSKMETTIVATGPTTT